MCAQDTVPNRNGALFVVCCLLFVACCVLFVKHQKKPKNTLESPRILAVFSRVCL